MVNLMNNNSINDDNRFPQLVKALKSGWEIEEPVLIGTTWGKSGREGGIYHFVLRKRSEDKTTLLSLPPSSQLLTFLSAHQISVSKI